MRENPTDRKSIKSLSKFDEFGRELIQKSEGKEYLKIGDIISLQSEEDVFISNQLVQYTGVIFGDGIAYTDLECISRDFMFSKNQNFQFRQSLFRIEPAHQYGFSKYYDLLLNDQHTSKENLQRYKQKCKEELIENEAELEQSYGQTITYGERVQLRHLHSNFFATTSVNIAKEHGCLKVTLVEGGNEGSWIELLPGNKLRQEGEPIRYQDELILSSRIEKSNYYLKMGTSGLYKENLISELNASGNKSLWKALKYISYTEIKINPLLVSSGDSFRICNHSHGGYLSIPPRDISALLPPDLDLAEVYNDETAQCPLYLPKAEKGPGEVTKKLDVFIEKGKSGRSLWELERIDPFIGGVAMVDEFFRIKNVATGMYLEITRAGNIVLKSDPKSNFNIFSFIEIEPSNSPQLNFNTSLRMKNKATGFYLGTAERENLASSLLLETQENLEPVPLIHYKEDKNQVNMTFVFIDVPEISSIEIYQISRVVLKIVDFYSFLNEWGMLRDSHWRWAPSYELALSTESELQGQVEQVSDILKALNRKIVISSDTDHETLKQTQETIKDTGLLDLLLKLAILVSKRIGNDELVISEKSPNQIAETYLVVLIKRLYQTVGYCIKNNPKNCGVLKNYDEFLSSQLTYYKSEVNALLKETFKHSVDIMNKISIEHFAIWTSQVTFLNEVAKNIVDQTLVLMILASFCVHQNKGLQKYQSLIEMNLFQDSCNIKLLAFATIEETECIEFLTGSDIFAHFFKNNPTIASLYENSGMQTRVDSKFIPIASLSSSKALVNYVSAFIDLLCNLCLSRYESVKPKIQKNFEITSHYIMACIKNPNLHLKIRLHFMKLARVMYLDVNPIVTLTRDKDRCFFWDASEMTLQQKSWGKRENLPHFPTEELEDFLFNAWTSQTFPCKDVQNYSVSTKLKFTHELLNLTQNFLNLGYTGFAFFIDIYPSLVKLIFDYSNNSIVKLSVENHWCSLLKIQISDLQAEKVNSMLLAVLKVFSVGNCMRRNKEIELFLTIYAGYLNGKFLNVGESVKNLVENSQCYDFSNAMFKASLSKKGKNIAGAAFLGAFNRVVPLTLESSISQSENYQLDSCLLSLLFKNSQSIIEQRALTLVLENFNHQKNFLAELDEVTLLYNLNQQKVYLAMQYCTNSLENLFVRLLNQVDILRLYGEPMERAVENSYIDEICLYFKQIVSLLNITQPKDHLFFAQNIARNLAYHKVILKFFLNYNLPWLDPLPKRIIVNSEWKPVYKLLVHSLFSFAFKNNKNQLLIYPKITSIVYYFGNSIGTSTLLSQVLACQKDNAAIEKIIAYIFSLFNKTQKIQDSPHDLKMLLTLLVDEKKKIQKFIQLNVIKALVSSSTILDYYTENNVVIFLRYFEKDIKFHAAIVSILAYCCANNEFAINQCQRLFPYQLLIKELMNKKICYKLKKAYLHFLCWAYMNSNYGKVDYDGLEELFNIVIIPDLLIYRDFCQYLPDLAHKEAYKTVSFRKEIRVEPRDPGYMVREYLDDDEVYVKNISHKSPEEVQSLNYWKYLISAKPWKIELVTGLLIFIHDLCIEMKFAGYQPNIPMQVHLRKIFEIISEIKNNIQDFANQFPKLNFEFLLDTINVSLSEIPTNFKQEISQHNQDFDYLDIVLQRLADHAKSLNLTPERFIFTILKISSEYISIELLTLKCKGVFGSDLEIEDISRGLKAMGQNISIDELTKELKIRIRSNLIKGGYSLRMMQPEVKVSHLNSKLKLFVKDIKAELNNDNSFELTTLVNQVKTNIVDVALKEKDFSKFHKFIKNIEIALSNPEHKVYLMEIFRQMILIEKASELDQKVKIQRVQMIQQGLLNVNIGELCLRYLTSEYDLTLVSKSLKLLQQLLEGCEVTIKDYVLADIQRLGLGLKFFSFVCSVITQFTDRLLNNDSENALITEICFDILLILRLLCNGCYTPFQLYLLEQPEYQQRVSIDIVSEIIKFICNLQGLKDVKVFSEKPTLVQQLLIECFKALTSFCQGPCEKVQIAVAKHPKIYRFVSWVFDKPEVDFMLTRAFYQLASPIVLFLLSVLEGDTSETIACEMLNLLNFSQMLKIATIIYNQFIKPKITEISRETSCDSETEFNTIVNIGYNISILFLKFQQRFPSDSRFTQIFQTNSDDVHEFVQDDEAYNYQEAIVQNVKSVWQKLKSACSNGNVGDNEISFLKKAHFYYTSTISSVEIQFKDNLCKLYFRIPPMCKFLTRKSRQDIVIKVGKKSHQEKIEDFFNKSKIYEYEMRYQQSLSGYKMLDRIVSYWNFYGFIAFISVVTINITMLFTFQGDNFMATEGAVYDFLVFCGTIQLISAILFFISYTIEYFPIIIKRELLVANYLTISDMEKYQRVKGTLLMKQVLNSTTNIEGSKGKFFLRFIFKDFQMIYCIIYLIISLICWYHLLLYSLLLLDLVKRNDTLINILKSISQNYKQLLLTLIFGIFLIFMYSTIYMIFFSAEFFEGGSGNNFYCSTLGVCFVTVLNSGTRSGGGVGDILDRYSIFDTRTIFRIITDMSFFIIVVIVLLNIIFGIIIDTFAELRDQQNELMKDLHENCFICGNNRFQFAMKRISWKLHIHLHHSLHSYLAFLVYIRQKDFSKCNGAEMYTKEKILNNDVSFFPRTSISLLKFEKEFKDSQEKVCQEYVEKLKNLKRRLEY